jgi:hypothetical protein
MTSVLAGFALLGLLTSAGHAFPRYPQTATTNVPPLLTPNDMHVTFTGTGGTIKSVVVAPPVGAGSVTVQGGNRINIVWDTKLAPNDPVTIDFTTDHAPIGVDGGKWTNDGDSIGVVTPASITLNQGQPVPGASPMVMLLLAIAVAAGGAMMLRRRVEA